MNPLMAMASTLDQAMWPASNLISHFVTASRKFANTLEYSEMYGLRKPSQMPGKVDCPKGKTKEVRACGRRDITILLQNPTKQPPTGKTAVSGAVVFVHLRQQINGYREA